MSCHGNNSPFWFPHAVAALVTIFDGIANLSRALVTLVPLGAFDSQTHCSMKGLN